MNIVAYLHFIAFIGFVLLLYFIVRKGLASLVNRSFAVLLVSMMLLSFCQCFMHNIFIPKNIALIFWDISTIFWASLGGLFLWFVLIATGDINLFPNRKWAFVIFLPALFFICLQFNHKLVVDIRPEYFGWGMVWTDGGWFYLYWAYCFIWIIFAFILLIKMYRRSTDHFEKKASFLLVILSGPVMFALFIFDGLLPKLNIRMFPEMTDLICLFWCSGLVYIIVRYHFLLITPILAAADIIRTMRDSLILVTGTKRIVVINQYTSKLLGYKREELLDKDISIVFSEKDKSPFDGGGFDKLLEEGVLYLHNVFYKTRSGEKVPVSFTAVVRYDNYKRVEGIIIIARDIRETLKLYHKEKELVAMTVRAEVKSKKAEELKKAYDKLKETQDKLVKSEKMRTVGELGTTIVREMKKPLDGIVVLIRARINAQVTDASEYKKLKEIELECLYLQKMLEDFRNYAVESFEKIEDLDLKEMLESTVNLMSFRLSDKGIKIEQKHESGLPKIKGDRRHIQQVLINLLTKSIDFYEDGRALEIGTRSLSVDNKEYIEAYFLTSIRSETGNLAGAAVGSDDKNNELSMTINYLVIKTQGGELFVEKENGKNIVYTVRFPLK